MQINSAKHINNIKANMYQEIRTETTHAAIYSTFHFVSQAHFSESSSATFNQSTFDI